MVAPSPWAVKRVALGSTSLIPWSYRHVTAMLSQGTEPVWVRSHSTSMGSWYRSPS